MASFLLIHGASHGAWCWRDLIPELAALGHEARAIDLPGHGDDPTPRETVTLDSYREAILAELRAGDILVGHSMGGYPITAAAEAEPDRVRALVYLCAYIPAPGRSLASLRKAEGVQLLDRATQVDGPVAHTNPELAPVIVFVDFALNQKGRGASRRRWSLGPRRRRLSAGAGNYRNWRGGKSCLERCGR